MYAQKCSDPDIAFRAAFTQFLMEPCTQSGDSNPVTKSHTQTQAVQHACRLTYQTAIQLLIYTLTDRDTDIKVQIVTQSHTCRSHTNIEATVIYTHSHKHTQLQLPGATIQRHTYILSQTQ